MNENKEIIENENTLTIQVVNQKPEGLSIRTPIFKFSSRELQRNFTDEMFAQYGAGDEMSFFKQEGCDENFKTWHTDEDGNSRLVDGTLALVGDEPYYEVLRRIDTVAQTLGMDVKIENYENDLSKQVDSTTLEQELDGLDKKDSKQDSACNVR